MDMIFHVVAASRGGAAREQQPAVVAWTLSAELSTDRLRKFRLSARVRSTRRGGGKRGKNYELRFEMQIIR